MATRDVVNVLGQVVGSLTLPDGTSEEVWQLQLAVYAIGDSLTWDQIYRIRIDLFAKSDWIRSRHLDQVALGTGTTLTSDQYTAWLVYWQKLRDLTDVYADAALVVFPNLPTIY